MLLTLIFSLVLLSIFAIFCVLTLILADIVVSETELSSPKNLGPCTWILCGIVAFSGTNGILHFVSFLIKLVV
jgi:hypothetical protein